MRTQGTDTMDPCEGFVAEAERSIRAEQSALARLLKEAGLEGARATDLGQTLGLDKTLASKLTRFLASPDAPAAFKHLPGVGGVEILIRAAEGAGVGRAYLEGAQAADRELRAVVRKHAGDRRAFEAMLTGAQPDARNVLEERRSHFRSGSAIWGVRAKAQFLTLALRPSRTENDRLDCVQVSGFVGLELLRPDMPWVVRRLSTRDDDFATRYDEIVREPLDPRGATDGDARTRPLSLLPEFCTQPPPVIRQRVGLNGWLYDELAPGGVGRSEARDITAGELYHAIFPSRRTERNVHARYRLIVRTPVEGVQFDLLLHPDLAHFRWPITALVGGLEEQVTAGQRPERELQPEQPADAIMSWGAGTPTVPGYGHIIADALARAGWEDASLFRGYRAAIEYPPPPCEVSLTCGLDA